jgi:hypothetical protein
MRGAKSNALLLRRVNHNPACPRVAPSPNPFNAAPRKRQSPGLNECNWDLSTTTQNPVGVVRVIAIRPSTPSLVRMFPVFVFGSRREPCDSRQISSRFNYGVTSNTTPQPPGVLPGSPGHALESPPSLVVPKMFPLASMTRWSPIGSAPSANP